MTVPLIGTGAAGPAHPPIVLWAAECLRKAVELRRVGSMPAPAGILPGRLSGDEAWALAVAQQLFLAEQRFQRPGEAAPFLSTNLLEVMGSVILWDLTKRRLIAWLTGQPEPPLPGQLKPDEFETAVKSAVLHRHAEQRRTMEQAVFEAVKAVVGEGYAPLVTARVSDALLGPAGPALRFLATAEGRQPGG